MSHIGRPIAGDRVSVRLPADILAELDRLAARAGMSGSAALRLILTRTLSANPIDGGDRTQITERLTLTPAERVRRMAEETRRLQALSGRAQ